MATDENNHKNEARDDWTGCTFRVERGPSSEGRAWGMADILTDVGPRTSRWWGHDVVARREALPVNIGPADIFGGRVTSSLRSQDGAGITVAHARATDEAMKCAKSGNCDATLVVDFAPTDGAPLEITMRRSVELLAFLELPEEEREARIAGFGPMEE